MKKLIILNIILSITAIILSIYAINNTYSTLSDKELFIKKRECAELQNKIEARIKRDWNDEIRSAWLEKIFYSPKRNSCMYTIQILSTINNIAIEDYNLFDAYTNEKIERERGCLPEGDCGKSLMSATIDFNNKVAKYE